MRAGANPDALFFATHRHMRDLLIFVQEIDELKHIDVWNTGYQVDARFFQAGENLLRSLKGSHFIFLVEDSRYRCQAVMNGAKSPRVKPISSRANGISTARISGRPHQGPGQKTFRGKVSGFFLADRFSAVLMVLTLLFLFTSLIPAFKRKRQKFARGIGGQAR